MFWLRHAATSGQPAALRLLARAQLAAPTPDLPAALAAAGQLAQDFPYDPSGFQLRALAHARLGDFGRAQEAQGEAIVRAKELRWNTRELEAELEDYRANRMPAGPVAATGSARDLIWQGAPEASQQERAARGG